MTSVKMNSAWLITEQWGEESLVRNRDVRIDVNRKTHCHKC
jgi:hypothetical protein